MAIEPPDLEITSPEAPEPGPSPEPGFFSVENMKSLGILLLIIFAIRWSVASPYHVPTASMEPTIKVGDRLLAFKLAYNLKIPFTNIVLFEWSRPKPGDIIVFRFPKPQGEQLDYVKRVVGVSGDKVEVSADILVRNSTPQPRKLEANQSILDDIQDQRPPKDLFLEKLEGKWHWTMQRKSLHGPRFRRSWPDRGQDPNVGKDSVFVMGDNRDNSHDSRAWGLVPMENILGKAILVLWSKKDSDSSFALDFRLDRFGHWLDQDANERARTHASEAH